MPTKIETQEVANIAEALRKETRGVCENIPVVMKDWNFTLDFCRKRRKDSSFKYRLSQGKIIYSKL